MGVGVRWVVDCEKKMARGISNRRGSSIVARRREGFGRSTLIHDERARGIDSGVRKGSGAREVYAGGR